MFQKVNVKSRGELAALWWREQAPDDEVEWLEIDMSLRFDSGRHAAELVDTRTLRALVDGVTSISLGGSLYQPIGTEVTWSSWALEGAQVADETMSGPSYKQFKVEFPRPLRVGETRRFVQVDSFPDSLVIAPLLDFSPGRRTEKVVLRVQFADELPACGWYYEGLLAGAEPGHYSVDRRLNIDRFGYAFHEFTDLELHMQYGLAWTWPD